MATTTYAALLSLVRALHQILNLEQLIVPLHKQKLVSLHEKVDSILAFLEDYSEKHHGTHDRVVNETRNAAYEAQDFMDSYLCSVSTTHQDRSSYKLSSLDQDLNMALERITFIWEASTGMKNSADTAEDIRPVSYSSPVDSSSTVKTMAKDMDVGFDDDFNAIKERLYQDSDDLQIIPIVGMGGIGKTTLARKVYNDSLLSRHFDIDAWITMSAEYQRREILLGILQKFKKPDDEQYDENRSTENSSEYLHCFKPSNELSDKSDAELETLVYKNLIGRRYLIVIDDIWSTKDWDDLKKIFADDGSGSRILLTTRISDVAVYAGSSSNPLHQMKFLSEDHSWKLLQERIFGQESCPFPLVEIGKKIARNCGGLPLTIVVVAGLLLSSGNITSQELWENISENISSTEPTIALQCSKILCLSYDKLPLRLKPCFLYIAAFPEDMEINVSKLIKLWVAEGFVRPNDNSNNCLEDVGEGYLEDLVNRSLILVNKREVDGKLEVVGIHDLLREICITKAEKEGFLQHVSSKNNTQNEVIDNPSRRISIHYTETFQEWPIKDSSVRSLLLFSERDLGLKLSLSCRSLGILDAPDLTWPNFSDVIPTFVNLRYISFALNNTSCPHGFPASITKLPNLRTIIARVVSNIGSLEVPCEILEMPKLIHLIMNVPFRLSYPSNVGIVQESGLQTLDGVVNFRFTKEAVKTFVNLKKLIVVFTLINDTLDDFNLENLFHLQNLEELKVSVHNFINPSMILNHYFPIRLQNLEELKVSVHKLNNPSRIWNHCFPISLKKLTLCGVPLPWKNMTIIGSLPNLQVLEMMDIDVSEASEWTPTEGQFLQLRHFRSSLDYVVKWEVEKEHFPSLESLTLCRAWIDEIPCGIGEIDSLQLIELMNCHQLLVISAQQIQKQQYENGNDTFQLRVNKYSTIQDEYKRKGTRKGIGSPTVGSPLLRAAPQYWGAVGLNGPKSIILISFLLFLSYFRFLFFGFLSIVCLFFLLAAKLEQRT